MKILLNGTDHQVQSSTVATLLQEFNLLPSQVAVEHNGTVLFQQELGQTPIREGDRIEIIRVVAGG